MEKLTPLRPSGRCTAPNRRRWTIIWSGNTILGGCVVGGAITLRCICLGWGCLLLGLVGRYKTVLHAPILPKLHTSHWEKEKQNSCTTGEPPNHGKLLKPRYLLLGKSVPKNLEEGGHNRGFLSNQAESADSGTWRGCAQSVPWVNKEFIQRLPLFGPIPNLFGLKIQTWAPNLSLGNSCLIPKIPRMIWGLRAELWFLPLRIVIFHFLR